jgi:hypothetical protein
VERNVARRKGIHFWTPAVEVADLSDWDPDSAPERYASGVGHGIYELFVRMSRRGLDVSLGVHVPANASVVVVHANSLHRSWDTTRLLCAVRDLPIVLIRSDVPLRWQLPVPPEVEVMPNRSSCATRNQVWLPLLPQRGLRPRAPERRGHVEVVTVKSNPENVPEAFRSQQWTSALHDLGMQWVLDAPKETDGPDNRWNDFSNADVSICFRGDGISQAMLRKPATRLINAWSAGCIPLVGPEPAYLELVTDGEDALVVDSVDSCLAALRRLRDNSELVARLEAGCERRATEFALDRVLDQWESLVRRAAARPPAPCTRSKRLAAAAVVTARASVRRVQRTLTRE